MFTKAWLVKTIFEWQVDSTNGNNLLYDDVDRHYLVVTNMWKRWRRSTCVKNETWRAKITSQTCDQTCSDCMARTPCDFSAVRNPSADCNRHFMIRECFDKHKQSTAKNKSVRERKRWFATFGGLKTR